MKDCKLVIICSASGAEYCEGKFYPPRTFYEGQDKEGFQYSHGMCMACAVSSYEAHRENAVSEVDKAIYDEVIADLRKSKYEIPDCPEEYRK